MKRYNSISTISLFGCVVGTIVSHTDAWIISVQPSKMSRHELTQRQQQLLHSTSTPDATTSPPTTTTGITEIIGNGRIGSLLAQAGNCKVLGRNDQIDPNNIGAPIYIATRNDALESIIDNCPISRKDDLVFLQNGYLDNLLASKNLLSNTQVLLYLSVPTKDATPIDGITSYNPEGLTTATGLHANAFAERLKLLNMKCNIVEPNIYRPAMFEKLMYVSFFPSVFVGVILILYYDEFFFPNE
jgi:hypothetical protein